MRPVSNSRAAPTRCLKSTPGIGGNSAARASWGGIVPKPLFGCRAASLLHCPLGGAGGGGGSSVLGTEVRCCARGGGRGGGAPTPAVCGPTSSKGLCPRLLFIQRLDTLSQFPPRLDKWARSRNSATVLMARVANAAAPADVVPHASAPVARRCPML